MIRALSITNLALEQMEERYCSLCKHWLLAVAFDPEMRSLDLHTSGFLCVECRTYIAIADNALNLTQGICRP